MTADPRHYVPVLKVKMGEKFALGVLNQGLKRQVTPLLEIVERQPTKASNAHLDTAFKNLAASLHGYPRCYIDTREIHLDGPVAAEDVFRRATAAGMSFVPITGIERQVDVSAAMANRTNGIGLRVPRDVYLQGGFQSRLQGFMRTNCLTHPVVDLILDLGLLEDMVTDGVYRMILEALNQTPDQNLWRTLTVIGCAIPKKLGAIPQNQSGELSRWEWLGWRDGVYTNRGTLGRVPSFGDCVIQHPSGVENYNPAFMPMTAKIKYTLSDSWLVIRGESNRVTLFSQQFPRLASQLVTGQHRAQYMGPGHCHGCHLIQAAANGAGSLGSAGKWCQIGAVHHISVVAEAMNSLAWP